MIRKGYFCFGFAQTKTHYGCCRSRIKGSALNNFKSLNQNESLLYSLMEVLPNQECFELSEGWQVDVHVENLATEYSMLYRGSFLDKVFVDIVYIVEFFFCVCACACNVVACRSRGTRPTIIR
jgi:hypothetical protein